MNAGKNFYLIWPTCFMCLFYVLTFKYSISIRKYGNLTIWKLKNEETGVEAKLLR